MANRTQDEVRREFFASRGGWIRPPRFRWSGNTVIENGILYYAPSRNRRVDGVARIPLARYSGPKRTILLINGEAFRVQGATVEQNALRRAVEILPDGQQRAPAWHTPPEASELTGMTVPFAALESAGVQMDTIRAVEVSPDRWDEVQHEQPSPPNPAALVAGTVEGWTCVDHPPDRPLSQDQRDSLVRMTFEGVVAGRRYRVLLSRERQWNEERHMHLGVDPWRISAYHLRATPVNGVVGWQALASVRVGGWIWEERIHRLGASVFTAVGYDGKRHRYISAFDQQEATPMYYLAQLPDRGACTGYEDALNLLAPEIVHRAQEEGRTVYRQGDVFAVEVNLTTEEVYERALYRVRREVVLQDGPLERRLPPAEGEVSEKVPCPTCNCRGRHVLGSGEKARRALMIHGTAHTADEVVVCAKGVTFVRGVMHHDPHLEEPGRRPEHTDVRLFDNELEGRKPLAERGWYLAVRNTVPRQRRRPIVTPEPDALPEQQELEVAEVAA